MKIAMHEITTRHGTFEDHLAAYEETGWRHFEINLNHAGEFIARQGPVATARRVADHGLSCVGATGMVLHAFQGEAARHRDLETVERNGEILQALQCRPLVVGATGPEPLERARYGDYLDALAEHIQQIATAADRFAVQIAIEVNWVTLCRSFSTAAQLLERINRPNVGVAWDPAHFYSTPSRLKDLERFQGKIVHAHLNDMRAGFIETVDINGDRVIPGQGILPLRAWIDHVTGCGYEGYHCVELFNEELWAKDLKTICREVMAGCKEVWPEARF